MTRSVSSKQYKRESVTHAMKRTGRRSVEQGMVKSKHVDTDLPRITRLLDRLNDRTFPEWTEKRAGYFAWHTNNVSRDV